MIPGGISNFLEEDSSVQLLFGDIFLMKTINSKIKSFDVSEYSEFYNIMFGGFDDCDTDTLSDELNTEEEDEDFIPESEEELEEEYENVKVSDDELGEDMTDY